MGIYWDDWQAILLSNMDVPNVFWNYYLFDRPFSIWTYLLPLPVAQNYPIIWQFYGILARWFAAVGFWFFLRGMFPARKQEAAWITLLWSFYPGFFYQSVSIAFCQHFITYGLFNFSLAAMVLAIRKPKHKLRFTILAILTSFASLMTMEYFVGLELLRPLILLFLIEKDGQSRSQILWQVIKKWLPYLVIIVFFVLYRFIILGQLNKGLSSNDPQFLFSILNEPFKNGLLYVQMMLQDVVYLLLHSWGTALSVQSISLTSFTFILSVTVGILIGLLAFWIVSVWQRSDEKTVDSFFRNGITIAILAIIFGGIPIWSLERQVVVGMWSNRFALAPMFGVAILTVIFWRWVARNVSISNLMLTLLLALSISFQVRTVNQYQNNWLEQKRFYSQVLWRIPALERGTALLSPTMPFGKVAEYSIAFAINVIYADEIDSMQLPYYYLSALRYRFGENAAYEKEQPIRDGIRSLYFEGSTSNVVVFYEAPYQRCIWVVNSDDSLLPGINQETSELFAISDYAHIGLVPAYNVERVKQIFGAGAAHNWCYYYQKAELAAQFGDWQEVISLQKQSNEITEKPKHGRELFPFIQAYAHMGDWNMAKKQSLDALELNSELNVRLCAFWNQLDRETEPSPEKNDTLTHLEQTYGCQTKD